MNPEEQALDRARHIVRAMQPAHPLKQPMMSCSTLHEIQRLARSLPWCDFRNALEAVEVVDYSGGGW